MVYVEFEIYRREYIETQRRYDEIITEKEDLFARTQPKSVQFDSERVAGGTAKNSFDEYLIQKERKKIDLRLEEARSILLERETLLKLKEEELRESEDVLDKLYCCRILDHMKIHRISRLLNYSESHIYRMLGVIYREVKKMRENESF